MLYSSFIDYLGQVQTARVKAVSFPESCSVSQFPDAFCRLLVEIVSLIDKNIHLFCHADQVIGLFGLQGVASAIQSPLPTRLDRVAYPFSPDSHFCYILNYLIFEKENPVDTWAPYQSLIIDFTTGEIMDTHQYLYRLSCSDQPGRIYGQLKQDCLDNAWQEAFKHAA